MPKNGTKKISPIRPPHRAPLTAPLACKRRLMKLHLAIRLALDDDHVLEVDEVGLLCLAGVGRDLLRVVEVVVGDGNEIAHRSLLSRLWMWAAPLRRSVIELGRGSQ